MPTLVQHEIEGGGGTKLHAIEAGPPDAPAIVFIHGFSQCALTWSRQLDSSLARDHRLIAVDLRGHGRSARPPSGYDDGGLWADDIDALIRTLGLRRPVLSGWSYGPLVILDYLQRYGESAIGGVQFVGGISQLGSEQALASLTPAFRVLIPDLLATDAEQAVRGLSALAALCYRDLAAADRDRMLGAAVSVPAHVRRGLFARVLDNDDLLRRLRKPVLLTHGERDAVVRAAVVRRHRALVRHAQVDVMPGAGHAPFWDDCEAFNDRLRRFVAGLSLAGASAPQRRSGPSRPARSPGGGPADEPIRCRFR